MTDPVVLVSLDGSSSALSALAVARRLGDLQDVRIRILHASEQAQPLAAAILQAAADSQARLVVVGAYSEDTRPDAVIGEAALAVLRGAACPVVLVDPARALSEWRLKRVLVPHDGSPTVSDALRPAAELARRAGAELVVLQAAGAESAAESGSIAPPLYVDQPQHEWPAWADEFSQRLASVCPLADVRVRLLVARGEPAEEAVRVANEESADLIVLAWSGHWEAQRAATLKAVLRAAPCPVMVTRVPAP